MKLICYQVVGFYTFLTLYEPFLLIFVFDKSLLLYFPGIKTLVGFNKCLYFKIHMASSLTFKYMIMLIVFPVYMFLSTPGATLWYFQLVIFLSNDIAKNHGPGPLFQNNFFNFMSWNLNSIAKDNFQRVNLSEAHNSLYNYDLISICETGLNDSVE